MSWIETLLDVGRLEAIRRLVTLETEDLSTLSREELEKNYRQMGRLVSHFMDVTCDATSTGRFFSRKRSWVYEATSRPSTDVQRQVGRLASRQSGGLVFYLYDLVRLRRQLFKKDD